MALDGAIPDPPDLSNRGKPRGFEWSEGAESPDFHREDLETLLHDSAWTIGYEEWVEQTDLTDDDVELVASAGLFQSFDFYWHPGDDQLRTDVPDVPADWRDRDGSPALDPATVSLIAAELQDLGRTVREALEDELERSDEVSDSLWMEQPYGDREE